MLRKSLYLPEFTCTHIRAYILTQMLYNIHRIMCRSNRSFGAFYLTRWHNTLFFSFLICRWFPNCPRNQIFVEQYKSKYFLITYEVLKEFVKLFSSYWTNRLKLEAIDQQRARGPWATLRATDHLVHVIQQGGSTYCFFSNLINRLSSNWPRNQILID